MTAGTRTVVVLHDVDSVRSRNVRYLSSQGLHVMEAGTPREAIECLDIVRAECVVIGELSAGMPETLKWIAEIHKGRREICVVFAPAADTAGGPRGH